MMASEIVKSSTDKAVVAPGTSGKKKITLENKGEVAIQLEDLLSADTSASKDSLVYAITENDEAPEVADWKDASSLAA